MKTNKTHKWYDVPCEMCLGTGKRQVYIYKNQPCLPMGILLKADEMFENCSVESSVYDGAEYAGFVLRFVARGSFEKVLAEEDSFRDWVNDNYPDEISSRLILSVSRIEKKE